MSLPKEYKHSQETRNKISQALMGHRGYYKGKKLSAEHRAKMSQAAKGKPKSKEHAKKCRVAYLGNKHTEETKQRMSKAHLGKKNPSWKGGIGKLPYPYEWTDTLKESIRQRDEHQCQLCGKTQEESRKLSIHHIDYVKENLDPANLITLCKGCNSKANYNRPLWTKFFQSQLKVSKVI